MPRKFWHKRLQAGHWTIQNSKPCGQAAVPLLLSVVTRRACLQAMTAPKAKEASVSPWIEKFLSLSPCKNCRLLSPQIFLVEWAKKGESLLRRVWRTNSKFTRAKWYGPYVDVDLLYGRIIRSSVFSMLSCGQVRGKVWGVSKQFGQLPETRISGKCAWVGCREGRALERSPPPFERDSLSPLFAWNT